ncbi:MAG: hypothetical protein RIQ79_671 [Verrucomicrobiota bacterium]
MPRVPILPALLAGSLLANAAFIAVSLRNHSATGSGSFFNLSASASTRPGAPRSTSTLNSPAIPAAPVAPELATALGKALNTRDPARLRDLLRAAGVEPDLVKQLVTVAVRRSYEARFKELQPATPGDDAEWWKDPLNAPRTPAEERALNERRQALQRERQTELAALLGETTPADEFANNPSLRKRYSALPVEKAVSLRRIEKDYQDLLGDLRQSTNGFELPADREAIRLLGVERERDIAALLTPEERAAHALRDSPTANTLRWRMTQFNASESEYRQIFAAQKAFDDQFSDFRDPFSSDGDPPPRDKDYWDRRRAAEQALNDRIRTVVGDERYVSVQLKQDQDYTTAVAATTRLGLPSDTPDRLYALRTPTVADSQKIAANPALSAADKKAALKKLAATTRAQVELTLGKEAADVYFKRGAMQWINQLERGAPLTLSAEGHVESGPRIK